MKTLLIVYHSMTGGARQMAEAAQAGAAVEAGVRCVLMPASDASAMDVLMADAYLLACPEMLGAISGLMNL